MTKPEFIVVILENIAENLESAIANGVVWDKWYQEIALSRLEKAIVTAKEIK